MLLAALLVTALVTGGQALTESEMELIKEDIRTHVTAKNDLQGNNPSLTAGLVRLIFHDCVSQKCDGCINTDNPSNGGLELYIDQMDELYLGSYNGVMSRADFWVLSAITVMETASGSCRGRDCTAAQVNIQFRTGREDCPSSPDTDEVNTFPNAHHGLGDTLAFFFGHFGFTSDESVALLGAHSLGRASTQNSGFRGPWVDRIETLDNAYYSDLLSQDLGWKQINLNADNPRRDPKWQWVHADDTKLMLNADMALVKNLDLTVGDGSSACTYDTCANSSVADLVATYATDNAIWIEDFSAVVQKMIEHGYDSLVDVTPDATVPPPELDALTNAQVEAMRASIDALINSTGTNKHKDDLIYPAIGGYVRLIFHDCVGGCDGCINLNNAGHSGLDVYIDEIETIYGDFQSVISRADFWALCAIHAMERASLYCPRQDCVPDLINFTFQTGRKDCSTSPSTDAARELPGADVPLVSDSSSYFKQEFGFTERETVALLGAHTLGRAHPKASGFDGPWVGRWDGLTNSYYQDLLSSTIDWTQLKTSEGKFQWVHGAGGRKPGQFCMINADMNLVKELATDGEGNSSCTYHDCQPSETTSIVEEFAFDNQLWISEFSDVCQKMMEHKMAEKIDILL